MLKKLAFNVSAGRGEDDFDLTPMPLQISFIYGIATEGLSDFEIAIADLEMYESVELRMATDRLKIYLGSVYSSLCRIVSLHDFADSLSLRFELQDCIEPEPSEIVTAIAEMQKAGGCSGNCDCGCH